MYTNIECPQCGFLGAREESVEHNQEVQELQDTIDQLTTDNSATLAEIEQLTAALVERDAEINDLDVALEKCKMDWAADVAQLKSANKDLQDWYDASIADAKRYQWIRQYLSTKDIPILTGRGARPMQDETDHIDSAVDWAMKGEQS